MFVVPVAGIVASTTFALGQMRARKEAERHAYLANIKGASSALLANDTAAMRLHLEAVPDELHRNWEWLYLNAESDQSLATLRGHKDEIWCVAFSLDGTCLVSRSEDNTVRLWDTAPYGVRYQQRKAARRRLVSAGCPAPRRTATSASAG